MVLKGRRVIGTLMVGSLLGDKMATKRAEWYALGIQSWLGSTASTGLRGKEYEEFLLYRSRHRRSVRMKHVRPAKETGVHSRARPSSSSQYPEHGTQRYSFDVTAPITLRVLDGAAYSIRPYSNRSLCCFNS